MLQGGSGQDDPSRLYVRGFARPFDNGKIQPVEDVFPIGKGEFPLPC